MCRQPEKDEKALKNIENYMEEAEICMLICMKGASKLPPSTELNLGQELLHPRSAESCQAASPLELGWGMSLDTGWVWSRAAVLSWAVLHSQGSALALSSCSRIPSQPWDECESRGRRKGTVRQDWSQIKGTWSHSCTFTACLNFHHSHQRWRTQFSSWNKILMWFKRPQYMTCALHHLF